MFKERELRIKEFTEMNAKLNQMKEQFKKELLRSSSQLAAKADEIERHNNYMERQKMFKKAGGPTRNNKGGINRNSMEPKSIERPRFNETQFSKASKALPKSIMACRNSIQVL